MAERWATVLARLTEGPAAYGPHDVEALCEALQRVVAERDRLARVLAVEQGDASQAPPGWRRDMHGAWRRKGWVVAPYHRPGWRVMQGSWPPVAFCDSAIEAMTAADAMAAAGGGQ